MVQILHDEVKRNVRPSFRITLIKKIYIPDKSSQSKKKKNHILSHPQIYI